MDLEVIERLMQMLSSSDVEELDVTEGNLRIRLAKHARGSDTPTASRQNAHSAIPTPISTEVAIDSDLHTIVAGLPGTFYRAPAPGAAPFIDVGDDVSDGQQLAIVEAMKMMNPVEADCAGIIAEILLDDAAAVQAGTPLFRIRKVAR